MIEKIPIIDQQKLDSELGKQVVTLLNIFATKINELCGIINDITDWIKRTDETIVKYGIKPIENATNSKMENVAENGKCAKNAQDGMLKCPFCNSELVREGSNNYWCKRCNLERYSPALYGSRKLWWALGIAVDALKEIRDVGGWVSVFSEQEIADQALGQMTALTKGGDNE